MKNQMINFLTERNSHWNLACGILVLLIVVVGCSDSGDSAASSPTAQKAVPPAYIGTWTGQDGSTVTFRNDWSGDYKSGGKSVNGGTFEIDETAKEIRFTMLGFDAGKYKIEQTPANNRMKLDGMEYRRTGGFDASKSDSTNSATSGEVPSESDLRPIVSETLQDFNQAIQQKDFGDFYTNISETWQSQMSAAELTEAFSPLYKQKTNFAPKDEAAFTFAPKPTMENDNVLKVEVNYPLAKSENVKFRLRYVKEAANWKLLGIRLNP